MASLENPELNTGGFLKCDEFELIMHEYDFLSNFLPLKAPISIWLWSSDAIWYHKSWDHDESQFIYQISHLKK